MAQSHEFTSGYASIEDIAQRVVVECAEAQGITVDELEVVPVMAIDEAEMPRALKNPDSLWQEEWDMLRRQIITEVEALGPHVD